MITIRNNWTFDEVKALFEMPFNDLIFQAHQTHLTHFEANAVQLSTLLSIKTGRCPEDCQYCPQSVHYSTELEAEKLMPLETVIEAAKAAKASGATRFCMGAAWRSPTQRNLARVAEMVGAVKELGLETCATLGMLNGEQAQKLKQAGLDYYNHNLDTSADYYPEIITTRTYQDRLDTLETVRQAGINVCCGGILGLGETREDRINFLITLANQPEHPQSVPINQLIAVKGTPQEQQKPIDPIEFVRSIAIARILMPHSFVRLSAGRENMDELMQAICFFAGANSIFYGEKLLTRANPTENTDTLLFAKLGLKPLGTPVSQDKAHACCSE